jgi:hypothetical protein
MSTFTEIAESILAEAKVLDQYAASTGNPKASFEKDVLENLPNNLEANRKSMVNLTQQLKRLSLGATGCLLESLFTVSG